MPHHGHTYAPITPPVNDPRRWSEPHCEPMFITTMYWPPRRRRSRRDGTVYTDTGGEYLITWYLGEIPENAVSLFTFRANKLSDENRKEKLALGCLMSKITRLIY